jgi:hypothetical protein
MDLDLPMRMKALAVPCLLALAIATSSARAETPTAGSPTDRLPRNIEQLTWFGERPSWSPDGKRISFMAKSFGDAFEIDVATRQIKLLTHFSNPGFLRVQFLPNGDYLLVGSRKFENVRTTRYTDQELWILKAGQLGKAEPLDQRMTEGVAISTRAMKIAYAIDSRTHPGEIADVEAAIFTADLMEDGGKPKLVNRREAVRVKRPDCVGAEPQNFRRDDRELIFVCYSFANGRLGADVRGVDLASGAVTHYLKRDDEYNEAEGLYPDGRHTLVESSRDQATSTSKTIDIWKLRLDPGNTKMERLTRWGDYPGYKASNPVVSPDGRAIAFQSARSTDEAGVGYGLFILRGR